MKNLNAKRCSLIISFIAMLIASCNQQGQNSTVQQMDSASMSGSANPIDAGKVEFKTESNGVKTVWLRNTSSDRTITFTVEHKENMGEMPVGNREEIKVRPQVSVILGISGDFGYDQIVAFEKLPYAASAPSKEQDEYAASLQLHALTGQSQTVKNSTFSILSADLSQ